MDDEKLDALRLLVEANTCPNRVIVVAGITEKDSPFSVASGLAQAFCSSGARIAVSLSKSDAALKDAALIPLVTFERLSGLQLGEYLQSLRRAYDAVIIEVPTISERAAHSELACNADGVLFAVESGRRVGSKDRELSNSVRRLKLKTLGVVTTASARRPNQSRALAESSVLAQRKLLSSRVRRT